MGIETKGMSRRSFLSAGAVVAAGAAFAGLAGCSPSGETKGAEATSAAAAGETRDLGSASFELTADTKQADETKEVDIVVVGSGMGGFLPRSPQLRKARRALCFSKRIIRSAAPPIWLNARQAHVRLNTLKKKLAQQPRGRRPTAMA